MLAYLNAIERIEEKEKFELVYNTYRHRMWYVAKNMLKDDYLAEDAVQDAFFALIRHLDKIDDIYSSRTKSFVVTIVKSKCIDIIRKRSGYMEEMGMIDEVIPMAEPLPLEQLIINEGYDQLLYYISCLDDNYRIAFELKYIQNLKDKEIADILNITPKNVQMRVYRAKKKLQEMLGKVRNYGTRG